MGLLLTFFQPIKKDLTLFIIVPLPIALLVYWYLKRLLRFNVVHTSQKADANYKAILELDHRLDWKIEKREPDSFIQAKTEGFPKTMASWGEQVSVRFAGTDVFVNSICDPDERPAVTACGRNGENVRSVIRAVNQPASRVQSKMSGDDHANIVIAQKETRIEDEKERVWWG